MEISKREDTNAYVKERMNMVYTWLEGKEEDGLKWVTTKMKLYFCLMIIGFHVFMRNIFTEKDILACSPLPVKYTQSSG